MPASLKGTRTEQNLQDAFAGDGRANLLYLRFARKADVEGFNGLAAVLRSIAQGKTGQARGHLDYLEDAGGAATGKAIGPTGGPTGDVPRGAIASETREYMDMYAGMARLAREEGVDELADWFETLAKAGRSHAGRYRKALDAI